METQADYRVTVNAQGQLVPVAMPIHVDLPTLEALQSELEAARQTIASLEARITSMSVTHDALCVELGAAEIEAAQERTARRRALDDLHEVQRYVLEAIDDASAVLCECERQRHAARKHAADWKRLFKEYMADVIEETLIRAERRRLARAGQREAAD